MLMADYDCNLDSNVPLSLLPCQKKKMMKRKVKRAKGGHVTMHALETIGSCSFSIDEIPDTIAFSVWDSLRWIRSW